MISLANASEKATTTLAQAAIKTIVMTEAMRIVPISILVNIDAHAGTRLTGPFVSVQNAIDDIRTFLWNGGLLFARYGEKHAKIYHCDWPG